MRLALIAAAALVVSGPDFAVADERRGAAQVQDGDTLVVAGERVRLLDVDAPELAQRCEDGPKQLQACGKLAAERLETKLKGQTIVCQGEERDDYDRLLACCRLNGEDLSTWLVASIARITGGNFRLLHRLFVQIGRILKINGLSVITDDVEAARSTLVIGAT